MATPKYKFQMYKKLQMETPQIYAEAAKAVSQVRGQSDSANEIVRLALRNMAGF